MLSAGHGGRIVVECHRRSSPLALLILGVLAFAAPVYAADVVELGFRSSPRDPVLEDLLYLAVGVELSRAGFSSSRVAGSGSLLMTAAYQEQGLAVQLGLTLSKRSDGSPASVEFVVAMDDGFEDNVGRAVRELLSSSGLLDATSTSERAPVPETTMDGILPEKGPATGSSRVPLPTVMSIYAESILTGTSVLGKLADVARYGFGAGLGGGVFWLADSWSLRVGSRAGTTRVFTNAGIDGGPLYLSSAVLGADLGTGRQSSYRLWTGLSAGVLVVTVAADQVRSKAVPYADTGAGVSFPVGYGFSLGGELRLQAAFETTLILEFSPAFAVNKEF